MPRPSKKKGIVKPTTEVVETKLTEKSNVEEVIVEPKKPVISPRDIYRNEEVEINGKKYKKNFRYEGTTDLEPI